MTLRSAMCLVVAALCVVTPVEVISSQLGDTAFDGGGGGGVNPSPPNAVLPVAPTLGKNPGNVRFVLAVVAPVRRVVVLRDRTGLLLDVVVATPRQPLLLRVPVTGALLDVLGTDVVGLPVTPGQQLTLVTH